MPAGTACALGCCATRDDEPSVWETVLHVRKRLEQHIESLTLGKRADERNGWRCLLRRKRLCAKSVAVDTVVDDLDF